MTNYEKLTRAMPKQLAEILADFNPDSLCDEYCRQCPIRETTCPIEHGDGDTCPVQNIDIVLWWLNQAVEK